MERSIYIASVCVFVCCYIVECKSVYLLCSPSYNTSCVTPHCLFHNQQHCYCSNKTLWQQADCPFSWALTGYKSKEECDFRHWMSFIVTRWCFAAFIASSVLSKKKSNEYKIPVNYAIPAQHFLVCWDQAVHINRQARECLASYITYNHITGIWTHEPWTMIPWYRSKLCHRGSVLHILGRVPDCCTDWYAGSVPTCSNNDILKSCDLTRYSYHGKVIETSKTLNRHQQG